MVASNGITPNIYMFSVQVKVLLSYGEHAREFLPVESMFHLLANLTSGVVQPRGTPEFEFSHRVLSHMDLFIVAVVNPDGRHLVETTGACVVCVCACVCMCVCSMIVGCLAMCVCVCVV